MEICGSGTLSHELQEKVEIKESKFNRLNDRSEDEEPKLGSRQRDGSITALGSLSPQVQEKVQIKESKRLTGKTEGPKRFSAETEEPKLVAAQPNQVASYTSQI